MLKRRVRAYGYAHASAAAHKPSHKDRGWNPVAAWYDKLVGESGSDYHQNVILPAALRILDPQAGESVIDVCCGQGVLICPLLDAKIGGRAVMVFMPPCLRIPRKTKWGWDS